MNGGPPKLDEETERLLDKIRFKCDPATGEAVPRDLSKLNPTEAVEILRTLRDAAEFGKEPTSETSNVARELYSSLSEKIGEAMPEVAKLLKDEMALTIARDAAQRVKDKYEAEIAKVNPLVYAGIAIALYLVSMAVGTLVVLAVGAAVTLFAFWRSVLCMTSRAAFYYWLGAVIAGERSWDWEWADVFWALVIFGSIIALVDRFGSIVALVKGGLQ